MHAFERNFIARAAVAQSVGMLPAHGDNVKVVPARPVRVRVLAAAFYHRDNVPALGDVLTIDSDDAAGLMQRGLVELVR